MSRFGENFDQYIVKNYYKTGALFSNAFMGMGEIMGSDSEASSQLFELGAQIGILFQLYDDYLDLLQTSASDKESFKDIRDSVVSLHFFVALNNFLQEKQSEEAFEFAHLYLQPNKSHRDIEKIRLKLLNNDVNEDAHKILEKYHKLVVSSFNSLFRSANMIDGAKENFISLVNYVVRRHN